MVPRNRPPSHTLYQVCIVSLVGGGGGGGDGGGVVKL